MKRKEQGEKPTIPVWERERERKIGNQWSGYEKPLETGLAQWSERSPSISVAWVGSLDSTSHVHMWVESFGSLLCSLRFFLFGGGGGVEGGGGIVAVHTSGGSIDSTVLCRLDITSGWVCCSCTLLRKVFLQVLWFPPLMWNPTLICFAIISCDLIRFDLVFPISRALLSSSSSSS